MRTISSLFIFIVFFSCTKAFAVNTNTSTAIYLQTHFEVSSFSSLLDLKVRDLANKRDSRVSLKERITLKLVQQHVRRQLKKQETVDIATVHRKYYKNAGLVGFLLGFLLGLVGVLISYLISRETGNASWGGFAALLLLILILFL